MAEVAPVQLNPPELRTTAVPDDFHMRPVDGQGVPAGVLQQKPSARVAQAPPAAQVSSDPAEAPPPVELDFVAGSLGVLEQFVGKFEGNGFNQIFRPNTGAHAGSNANLETFLELNVTSETLTFMDANILGSIPNRGFDDQPNVMLKGVPYTQMVGDLVNEPAGKANRKQPISIHFEQGLFLRTPATNNPKVDATIARLASIPHGATINAQCLEPIKPINGPPSISPISILPPGSGKIFENPLLRVPPNIQAFRDSGAIPLATEQNPNKILTDNNQKRNIRSHFTFTVSTTASDGLPGGGTSNIAFLMGQKFTGSKEGKVGSAVVANMTCTYWISTVLSDVLIPKGDYDKKPETKVLTPEEAKTGLAVPSFNVSLNRKVSADTKIAMPWTQIQYSQNVSLDFARLRWPHVSVATLIPAKDQPLVVAADSPLLLTLK